MIILVDPRAKLTYAWFYIHGLREQLGRRRVRVSKRGFAPLTPEDAYSYDRYVALIVDSEVKRTRLVVDYGDATGFEETAYEWCDVYAKVNVAPGDLGHQEKLMILGPGFGIGPSGRDRLEWAPPMLGQLAHWRDRRRGPTNYPPSVGRLAAEHLAWLRSGTIDQYQAHSGSSDYVFYAARLWEHHSCVDDTNPERAKFMRAAKAAVGKGFDGGFVSEGRSAQAEIYADLLLDRKVPSDKWISRTQLSAVAFNNPAVWGCLGWKLAQYMALGKAIISTPIENLLPEPLRHGSNVHLVSEIDEIPAALSLITTDCEYRRKLEIGSRKYWDLYLSPIATARRILDRALGNLV
ncbi:MAG: hypothetical protein WBN87_11680 [Thermoanaerobaculia bacterium]